jgi:hypothetical protein
MRAVESDDVSDIALAFPVRETSKNRRNITVKKWLFIE